MICADLEVKKLDPGIQEETRLAGIRKGLSKRAQYLLVPGKGSICYSRFMAFQRPGLISPILPADAGFSRL